MREIKCDHILENEKKHPQCRSLHIGNLILDTCLTCHDSLKGQVLEGILEQILATQRIEPTIFRPEESV